MQPVVRSGSLLDTIRDRMDWIPVKVHIRSKIFRFGVYVDRVLVVLQLHIVSAVLLALFVLHCMHHNLCFPGVVVYSPGSLFLDGFVDAFRECSGVFEREKLDVVVDVDVSM